VTRFPKTLPVFEFLFRFSLLGGGIGIAVCQPHLRSLTLFAVAIILPSIFIDNTVSSLIVHSSALVLYIVLGRIFINPGHPDVYSWGLGNFILFSIFGLLIGNSINRARFERFVYADSEKKLAEIQMRYAYYDRMTGLMNRRAYEEEMARLAKDAPAEYCIVMADINRLKETNDTIGHDAGDELINGASECLSAAFGGIETVFRIGGDEFCVVMTGPIEEAQANLETFRKLLSEWNGRYINGISAAAGVASNKESGDPKVIAAEADRRMYENKHAYYESSGDDRTMR
jgi:diguanylate cyclase (GGDEF)-like protein